MLGQYWVIHNGTFISERDSKRMGILFLNGGSIITIERVVVLMKQVVLSMIVTKKNGQ
jgi:hypothetical protein